MEKRTPLSHQNPLAFVFGHLKKVVQGWWFLYREHPIAALLIAVLLVLMVAVVWGWTAPRSTVIVAPFEFPKHMSAPLEVSGTTVANLLVDELRKMIREASEYSLSGPYRLGPSVEAAGGWPVPKLPPPPELADPSSLTVGRGLDPSNIGVEVSGLSLDRVLSEWSRFRDRRFVVTGDMISSPEGLTLRARIGGRSWGDEKPFHPTEANLKEKCKELARLILGHMRPDMLGIVHLKEKEYAKALNLYRSLTRREPKNPRAHYRYGVVLYLNSEFLADPFPRRAQDSLGLAIQSFNKGLILDPKSASAYRYLGYALLLRGRYDEAISAYQKARDLDPSDFNTVFNLGNTFALNRQRDKALLAYEEALQLGPKSPNAHEFLNDLGLIFAEEEQYDEAILAYEKALAHNPHYSTALYNVGNAFYYKGQLDDAIGSYCKALVIDPNRPNALSNLGHALLGKGHIEQAIFVFNKALEIVPRFDVALLGRGLAFHLKRELDDAIADYQRILEANGKDPIVLNNLADAQNQKGNHRQALALVEEALVLEPDSFEALGTKGKVLLELGEYEAAIYNFRLALEGLRSVPERVYAETHHAEIHDGLGKALQKVGREEEASRELAKAKQFEAKAEVIRAREKEQPLSSVFCDQVLSGADVGTPEH